ncbi:MAG: type VI secretion system protein TssA [Myxococcota bacterium]
MADLDELLKPVSDADPTGADVRYDAADLALDRIKQLRTAVSPDLDPDGRGRDADWRGVARECETLLRTRTKDLEVAGWLAEAWARLEGPAGLERGLALVAELVDRYWERLHPGWDADDGVTLPVRARPLAWLGGSQSFLQSLKEAPLVQASGGRVLTWALYEGAQRLDEPTVGDDRRAELVEAGAITSDAWAAALDSVSPAELDDARASLARASGHVDALGDRVASLFEDDEAPELHRLARLLRDIDETLGGGGAHGGAHDDASAGETSSAPEGARAPAARASGAPSGPIASREDALRRLREVADYFRRTEPHSPLASLIARGVRWGSMSFEEVLRDLARDDDFLGKIWETLGIEPARSSDDD